MTVLHDSQGNAVGEENPLVSRIVASDAIVPTERQRVYAETVQTHNAVSVGGSASSDGSWIDCDGFSNASLTMKNDGGTNSQIYVYWSNDGTNSHGYEQVATLSTTQYKQTDISLKARYIKVQLLNGDAVAHTMSAWAYLKA